MHSCGSIEGSERIRNISEGSLLFVEISKKCVIWEGQSMKADILEIRALWCVIVWSASLYVTLFYELPVRQSD